MTVAFKRESVSPATSTQSTTHAHHPPQRDLPQHLQRIRAIVVLRFGHDYDAACMQMDEVLASSADRMKNFAVIYLIDVSVPQPTNLGLSDLKVSDSKICYSLSLSLTSICI